MTSDESDAVARTRQTSWIVGLATVGTSTTGVIAFLVGVFATLSGELEAGGVCFAAAAIAFGALANAVLRR